MNSRLKNTTLIKIICELFLLINVLFASQRLHLKKFYIKILIEFEDKNFEFLKLTSSQIVKIR